MTRLQPVPGVLPLGQQHVSAWRNGGGVTREVDRSPAIPTTGDAAFDWRVSIAEVGRPGQFSAFPGVDRAIMLLSGGSMELTVNGRRHVLRHHAVFEFSGDSQTSCRLPQGPTQDLNVMTSRGRFRSATTVHDLAAAPVDVTGDQVLVLLSGAATVSAPHHRPVDLEPLDAVRHHPTRRSVSGQGVVALIELHRRSA